MVYFYCLREPEILAILIRETLITSSEFGVKVLCKISDILLFSIPFFFKKNKSEFDKYNESFY